VRYKERSKNPSLAVSMKGMKHSHLQGDDVQVTLRAGIEEEGRKSYSYKQNRDTRRPKTGYAIYSGIDTVHRIAQRKR
jgi:hypothetical protein